MDKSTRGESAVPLSGLPGVWRDFLGPQMDSDLGEIMVRLRNAGSYYPTGNIFNAFALCPPDQTRVVLMGQDPYHGKGEAHGLAFSVRSGVAIPPSLRNVFKEIKTDLGWSNLPTSGDLTAWAGQGVLLLNSILTVKPDMAGSHACMGWEVWTQKVLSEISKSRPDVVFVLWGGKAQKKKAALADGALVIEGAHPSPLAANRGGFFGGKYFSRANDLLASRGQTKVRWEALLDVPLEPT